MSAAGASQPRWLQSTHHGQEQFFPRVFKPCPWSDSDTVDDWAGRKWHDPPPSTEVPILSLCHVTHECFANLIMPQHAEVAHFSGTPKLGYSRSKVVGVLDRMPLFWLAPLVDTKACRKILKKKLKKAVPEPLEAPKGYKLDRISDSFANSPAFTDNSRYGPVGFDMSMQHVLGAMERHWGLEEDDIEFRVLGTFTYVKEWMHTVLICPKTNIGSVE
jgi:hypothetical protein